jgi:uncharacterized membrane protein YhfC
MPSSVHINAIWLVMTTITALFVIAYPLILGLIVRRRLEVGWKYFWFGALVFLVVQLLTRVPAVIVLQDTILAHLLKTSQAFVWTWLVILALTAALFEEVGRYLGYRLFMGREQKTWNKAVMYGLGHGGLESIVLVGGALLISLVNVSVTSTLNLNALPISEHRLIIQQFAALNAEPWWQPLLGAWERLWTVPLHVALSVIVLQVFRRNSITWLFLAIGLHAIVDFVTVAIPQVWGSSINITLIIEGLVFIAGLVSLWIIWYLREPTQTPVQHTSQTPIVAG